MRRISILFLVILSMLPGAASQADPQPIDLPSVEQQLARDRVVPGSALEQLILENQDFHLLRAREADDKIPVPLWLRVWWRKNNPQGDYSASDPAGGYPHVLKEIHEWMITHQDFLPGIPEEDVEPGIEGMFEAATVGGTNLRISGAQTSPRSESDIRMNYWDPTKIIGASNNISASGQQSQFYSTNGGATWGQTILPLQTGDAFNSDPTVDWTSDGTAWATTMGINSAGTQLRLRAFKSVDNGATWTFDGTISGAQTNTDKQIMWVDHSAASPWANQIYVCWHNGTPQYVNRRTAAGWGTPLQISGAETTGTAIGCDVKTNSAGDVFVFWPATGNRRLLIAKSTNGGTSYGTPVIFHTAYGSYDVGVPSFNNRRILIYVSGGAYKTDTKNLVYAAWSDLSGETGCTTAANEPGSNAASTCKARIWFSRSTNGGTTWSTPVKINNQAGLNDQFNQWLVVDEATGQLAIMYYDTVDDAARKKTHVYYQASFDDGVTWSTPYRVTTAQTDETVAGADSGNQYGDYNSISGINGSFWPVWTDRRNGAREEIWTANVQETGGPCTPPSAPAGLTAIAAGANQINLSWSAVAGATEYRILRGTASGGPYTQVGTTAGTTFPNTGLVCNTSYDYVVRAFNVCESASSSQASATTGACPPCATQALYSDGFESGTGLAGWSTGTFVAGGSTASWRGIQTCTAHGGSKIFRHGGTACTGNYTDDEFAFAQPNGAAGITVPAGATTTRLSFWHRREFENGYDGGTLAVSLDGTDYTLVPSAAILSGTTYNDTTDPACPPAGAENIPVFTGAAASFTQTTVDLDAVCNAITGGSAGCGGQAVRIGFTTITDCSTTGDGWFLDDVTVDACVPTTPTATGADYYTLAPCRLVDTRLADGPLGGPALQPGLERSFAVTGLCGVPSTAKALAVNVTITQALSGGYVRIYPGDQLPPVTSTINFPSDQTRANNAIVPLAFDSSGTVKVQAGTAGTVHFILDVMGYFQ
jgi:hypothetical protein